MDDFQRILGGFLGDIFGLFDTKDQIRDFSPRILEDSIDLRFSISKGNPEGISEDFRRIPGSHFRII